MAAPTRRSRLDLVCLDDRAVPSAVTATTTARPFDFVAVGSLTTSDQSTADGVLDKTTGTVNLAGVIDYTNEMDGQSGIVTVTGTGTGNETAPDPATPVLSTYAQTLQGTWAFADSDGTIASTSDFEAARNQFTVGNSGTAAISPVSAIGLFDVSTFKLQAGWNVTGAAGTSVGNLSVTLAERLNQATDLGFDLQSATKDADGTVDLEFSVAVTGNLMKAPTHDSVVTRVTAVWEGNGQSEAVDLELPVYWNTGTITVSAADLQPPAWAESITVKLDADQAVLEGDEGNNSWTFLLSELPEPLPPPPPPEPTVPPPPPAPPVEVPKVPESFTLVEIENRSIIEWRDATGTVFGASLPFDEEYLGDVAIATGDVNGDGILNVVAAAGDGGAPHIRVLDGQTGNELASFFAYDSEFRGGVNVAVMDLNGDGHADLVTGAGAGGGPHVKVFDGQSFTLITEFFAYDVEFRGGVTVAAADLDRDGLGELITGPGATGAPLVKVFDGWTGNERFAAYAAAPDDRDGVRVTAGTDASGLVVVGADPEGDTPAKRFHNQLRPGGPLLEEIYEPLPVPLLEYLG